MIDTVALTYKKVACKKYAAKFQKRNYFIYSSIKSILSLYALPNHLEELVTDFLVSEAVTEYKNIKDIWRANCELWVELEEYACDLKAELRSSGCSGITVQKIAEVVDSKQEFNKEAILESLNYFSSVTTL
ncbi:MAG: hypothetical protein L6243_05085 [Candidatus Altiarchaeales archaeon]|nr:hypothetical protein [Candidatus Altiarchaeota archaeon]MBU4341899.1 hypothetical protein [Candidatus Altiarchaeota archaeon]MCG2782945.1 hypothetical protein [Candidatus Altiarchaeales archaeon]